MHSTLLKLAAALIAACGVMEMFLVVTAVTPLEDARRVPVNAGFNYFMSLVLPLGIIAGAALIYMDRLIEGIGASLWAVTIQHIAVNLNGLFLVAFGLGIAGILVAISAQTQRDRVEQDEIRRVELLNKSLAPA